MSRNGYEQFNGRAWFRDETRGKGTYNESVGMISRPYFGLIGIDDSSVGLHMDLSTKEYGVSQYWEMSNLRDIEKFLRSLNVTKVEDLYGRVIEIYRDQKKQGIVGIGIEPSLVPRKSI